MQALCVSGKTFVGEPVLLICRPKRLHRPDVLLMLLTENAYNCKCLNRINVCMGICIHPQVAGVGAKKTVQIEVQARIATAKVSHFLSALCSGCASQLIPNCIACFIKVCEVMYGLEVVPANCTVPKRHSRELQEPCVSGKTFAGVRVLLICGPKRLHRPDAFLVLLTENTHSCKCLNRRVVHPCKSVSTAFRKGKLGQRGDVLKEMHRATSTIKRDVGKIIREYIINATEIMSGHLHPFNRAI
jgi:hypothetical protein